METSLSYKLDCFEGPLDLLLTLISRNKLNIYDIPIAELLEQYMQQIDAMREADMDIASEFLEMASRLLYMKTVSLLPRSDEAEVLKQELTGELIEYKICREMAEKLSHMVDGFATHVRTPSPIDFDNTYEIVHDSDVLYSAYMSAAGRGMRKMPPPVTAFTRIVAKKIVAVSTKIVFVMRRLVRGKQTMSSLFAGAKSRSELVATFLAVLELCKANRIAVNTDKGDAEITLRRAKNDE
ncbi:MAG: segregation/condensation protein A [Clostridia bacterium]|nr:segregation/condensation protein A [Clostridia bacterium]MBR3593973.1 segregation/condensation protein A [Clostridia bacterium]